MDREEAVRVLREFIEEVGRNSEERARLILALTILRDQLPLPGVFDTMESGKVIKL